jgi:hypothetical protein
MPSFDKLVFDLTRLFTQANRGLRPKMRLSPLLQHDVCELRVRGTRLHFALHPREKAALASEEGPEIVLLCGADAATLEVTHHAARS